MDINSHTSWQKVDGILMLITEESEFSAAKDITSSGLEKTPPPTHAQQNILKKFVMVVVEVTITVN